jgi:hypothetical protein
VFLSELKSKIDTTEDLLTGEGLDVLRDIRHSIFGEAT